VVVHQGRYRPTCSRYREPPNLFDRFTLGPIENGAQAQEDVCCYKQEPHEHAHPLLGKPDQGDGDGCLAPDDAHNRKCARDIHEKYGVFEILHREVPGVLAVAVTHSEGSDGGVDGKAYLVVEVDINS